MAERNKKALKFMKARAKNLMTTGVISASLFGVATAGILFLKPEEAVNITEKIINQITARASNENYELPPATAQAIADTPENMFMKSFSKVFSNIAKQTRPSLVLIVSEKKVTVSQPEIPDDFFFPFFPPQFGNPWQRGGGGRRQGIETDAGSGFIVDLKKGYVITNNHVINGAEKITVTTYDNRKYKATLVGSAENLDIAVLKLEDFKSTNELKQVSLGDSSKAEVGDWVVALGAPFELPQTLTMGVISALQRGSDTLGLQKSPNSFIQTDAAINPGNSGGPLVNLDGQVIGMNTAIYSKNGTSVGIGFAIPANTIRLAAESIINHGKLVQAYLGVEMYPLNKFDANALKEMKINPNTDGGLVMKVAPGSPAARAGLQPYDIIQSVNGVATKSPVDIQRQIMFLKSGTKVKLGVLRNGKSITIEAVVMEIPKQKGPNHSSNEPGKEKKDTQSLTTQYGIKLSPRKAPAGNGVVIARVQPGSVAEMAGLQADDIILSVNKQPVSSPEQVESILSRLKEANSSLLFLLVERNGVQSAVILQISP